MLLCVLSVGGEGDGLEPGWEDVGWGGRVGDGSVVDGGWWCVREGIFLYIIARRNLRDILGIVRFPMNLIMGVRSACAAEARRALVAANMVRRSSSEGGKRPMERRKQAEGDLVSRGRGL